MPDTDDTPRLTPTEDLADRALPASKPRPKRAAAPRAAVKAERVPALLLKPCARGARGRVVGVEPTERDRLVADGLAAVPTPEQLKLARWRG